MPCVIRPYLQDSANGRRARWTLFFGIYTRHFSSRRAAQDYARACRDNGVPCRIEKVNQ